MTTLPVRVFVEQVAVGRDHDHDLLRRAVARVAGCRASEVELAQRCSRCGGHDHGKVRIVHPVVAGAGSVRGGSVRASGVRAGGVRAGSHPAAGRWEASLARTPGLVAVAVCRSIPIGVDIESVDLVRSAPIDTVAFHPAELAELAEIDAADPEAGHVARARLWTRKESLLKATGDGLRVDPSLIRMTVPGSEGTNGPRLLAAPAALGTLATVQIVDLELGESVVGALSALTDGSLRIDVERLDSGQDLPAPL